MPPTPLCLGNSQSAVTKTSLFCLAPSKASAETLKFEANRGFIHKAAKQGEGKTSLRSASPKPRGWGTYGTKNTAAGWSEAIAEEHGKR